MGLALIQQGGKHLLKQGGGLISAQGPPAEVVHGPRLLLPGTSGNYASTPHAAGLNPTGDFSVVAYVQADDWNLATDVTIASKYISQTDGSWRFWIDNTPTSGMLSFNIAKSGVAQQALCTNSITTVTGVQNGQGLWLSAEYTSSDGLVDFHYSFDLPTVEPENVTWITLQLNRLAAIGPMDTTSTASLTVSGFNNGATQPFAGKVWRASGYAGVTQTLINKLFDMKPNELVPGNTSWVSSSPSAETWTLNGTAKIEYP